MYGAEYIQWLQTNVQPQVVEGFIFLRESLAPHAAAAWAVTPTMVKDVVRALREIIKEHPEHTAIEVLFALIILYILFLQRRKARVVPNDLPTPAEQEMLLREWGSEPFAPSPLGITNARGHVPYTITAYEGPFAKAKLPQTPAEKLLLNLASYDFLSYATDRRVIEVAKAAVRAYGVGSCGPRGFYGSMKPHIDLESALARFLGVHSAIIYSFQFATTSTLIPCFSARQDTILCDCAANVVIQKGCTLARSTLLHYRHNDVAHLEELMKKVASTEKKNGTLFRRWVVTEGVFKNTGSICPLPEIVALCDKYKFRLLLEDSYGFGALGPTGRGTAEHFDVPMEKIAIYVGSLSTSLGTVGGFCAGTNMVVDHQRLGATGYVFSASLPPFATIAGAKALELMEEEPERLRRLLSNSKAFRRYFSDPATLPRGVVVRPALGDISPVIHFCTTAGVASSKFDKQEDQCFATTARTLAVRHSILCCQAFYNGEEKLPFPASLRVVMKSELTEKQVLDAAKAVSAALLESFR